MMSMLIRRFVNRRIMFMTCRQCADRLIQINYSVAGFGIIMSRMVTMFGSVCTQSLGAMITMTCMGAMQVAMLFR